MVDVYRPDPACYRMRTWGRIVSSIVAGTLWGCATFAPSPVSPNTASAEGKPALANDARLNPIGVWEGKAISGCGVWITDRFRCNANVRIMLTFVREGSELSGVYKCEEGTMSCRNQNEGGAVRDFTSSGDELSFRVMMADGSSCIYSGQIGNNRMRGDFTCASGLSVTERGRWLVKRSY
jgi:hypothetical protein